MYSKHLFGSWFRTPENTWKYLIRIVSISWIWRIIFLVQICFLKPPRLNNGSVVWLMSYQYFWQQSLPFSRCPPVPPSIAPTIPWFDHLVFTFWGLHYILTSWCLHLRRIHRSRSSHVTHDPSLSLSLLPLSWPLPWASSFLQMFWLIFLSAPPQNIHHCIALARFENVDALASSPPANCIPTSRELLFLPLKPFNILSLLHDWW